MSDTASALFRLLAAEDESAFVDGQARLVARPDGAATMAEHFVPVVLAWRLRGRTMSPAVAGRLVGALTQDRLDAVSGGIFDRFLPQAANAVLGMDAFEAPPADPAPELRDTGAIARAIAFGACETGWLPPERACARDACRLAHQSDYAGAIQALTCLKTARRRSGVAPGRGEIGRFVGELESYLGWFVRAVASERLRWEWFVHARCAS